MSVQVTDPVTEASFSTVLPSATLSQSELRRRRVCRPPARCARRVPCCPARGYRCTCSRPEDQYRHITRGSVCRFICWAGLQDSAAVTREIPRVACQASAGASRMVHDSTLAMTRCEPIQGSCPSLSRTDSGDCALTTRTTRCSLASGPPSITKPSATSASMNAACSAKRVCSRSGNAIE